MWQLLHWRMLGSVADPDEAVAGGARIDTPAGARSPTSGSAPTLSPATRTRLLAINQLRRFRPRRSELPWRVMIGEWQPGFVYRAPPGLEKITDPRKRVLPPQLEVRVANALWTSLPIDDLDGLDVGVGRQSVWVAAQGFGAVKRIDARSGKLENSLLVPFGTAKRISVSRAVGKDGVEQPWVVDDTGAVHFKGALWQQVGTGAMDICAGAVAFDNAPSAGVHQVFRVNMAGEVEQLTSNGSVSTWAPLKPPPPNPFQKGSWQAITTVALERTPKVFEGVTIFGADLWVIRADDEVSMWSSPYNPFAILPEGAWDIGASDDGVVWALSTIKSQDEGSKGNALWRLDRDGKRWDRVSPGWGIAVDVDEDGNPWVLDSEGNLHVRGARMPGVFDNVRGMPKPGQSWPDYIAQLAVGGGLYQEAVVQSRIAGAGATVNLAAWSTYADQVALNPQFETAYADALGQLLAKERGIELLYCMAPIFTGSSRLPGALALDAIADDGGIAYVNFDVQKIIDAYVALLTKLATVPGFVERVRYLSLGNEVDVYFDANKFPVGHNQWSSYFEFCRKVIEKLRPVLPYTKFGVTWTFDGIQKYHFKWAELVPHCDALFVNYYAVHGANEPTAPATWYQVKTPDEYAEDFDKLIQLADSFGGDKPIVLQEVGMPTDPSLGGSNAQQMKFVEYVLKRWDEEGLRIRFLSWFALYDLLYDPTLKLKVENGAIAFDVTQYPYSVPGGPFWGTAHNLPGLFLGPYAPGGDPSLPITATDIVYWVNQSTTPGTHAERLTRFLGTCGLLAADGEPKSLGKLQIPGFASSGWDAFRRGLEKRRRQS